MSAIGRPNTLSPSPPVRDMSDRINTLLQNAMFAANNLSDVTNVAAARANLGIDQYTSHGDSDYTILPTDHTVGTSATISTPRTWTLPAASSVNPGDSILIVDMFGGITNAFYIVVAAAGADTIDGAPSTAVVVPYSSVRLTTDGVSKWSASVEVPVRPISFYGAPSGDDWTTVFNNFIAVANAAGVGEVWIPPGRNYNITGSLTTMTAPIQFTGSGIGVTLLNIVNMNFDVFTWKKSTAGRVNGGGIRDMYIAASSATGGNLITVDYFGSVKFLNLLLDQVWSAAYLRQFNNIVFDDVFINAFHGPYGIKAFGDSSTRNGETDRSDVLNLSALIVTSANPSTSSAGECILIDGFIQTVESAKLQVLDGLRGIRFTKTSGANGPAFFICHDFEGENTYHECIRVETAMEAIWLANPYIWGSVVDANTYFLNATRVKIFGGKSGAASLFGHIFDGSSVCELHGHDVYNNSLAGVNSASGIRLGNSASDDFKMIGGRSSGANQAFGIDVFAGARARAIGVYLSGNSLANTNGAITLTACD